MDPKLHVIVKDKTRIYFEGDVFAISSYNEAGLFDILPYHENFISLVRDKIVLHDNKGPIKEIKIESGLLKTNGDKVKVYLGV